MDLPVVSRFGDAGTEARRLGPVIGFLIASLDTTVVLLTPVVFATAARLDVRARPHVYACTHLAAPAPCWPCCSASTSARTSPTPAR